MDKETIIDLNNANSGVVCTDNYTVISDKLEKLDATIKSIATAQKKLEYANKVEAFVKKHGKNGFEFTLFRRNGDTYFVGLRTTNKDNTRFEYRSIGDVFLDEDFSFKKYPIEVTVYKIDNNNPMNYSTNEFVGGSIFCSIKYTNFQNGRTVYFDYDIDSRIVTEVNYIGVDKIIENIATWRIFCGKDKQLIRAVNLLRKTKRHSNPNKYYIGKYYLDNYEDWETVDFVIL